jgi:hypothetical protein
MNDGIETVVFNEGCITHDDGVKSILPTSARIEIFWDSLNQDIWTRAYSNYFTIRAFTINKGCLSGEVYSSITGQICNIVDLQNTIEGYATPSYGTSATTSVYKTPVLRTLKVGIKGDDVKRLQEFLGATPDGSFGRATAAKVKEWQAANGLTQDGLFGVKSSLKAGLNK